MNPRPISDPVFSHEPDTYDAVIIGAGFAGIYMLHQARERLGLKVRAFEKGSGVGGTWYWNTYPGARCDADSYVYCYSFSQEILDDWAWERRYPSQPELLEYLNFVADRLDLRKDISFNTTVEEAWYDDASAMWHVETDSGPVRARYLITAVGLLAAAPHVPSLPGEDEFRGQVVHTGAWPEEGVELEGKRIAVVGTGSTGVQFVPVAAKQAEHLYVLQRSPQFVIPSENFEYTPEFLGELRENYDEIWAEAKWSTGGFPWSHNGRSALEDSPEQQQALMEELWANGGFNFLFAGYRDTFVDRRSNDILAEFVRAKLRGVVTDSDVSDALIPVDHPIGARRPVIDTQGYLQTFNRDNVTLVDIRHDRLVGFTETGLRTEHQELDVDLVVYATGFDAITGPFLRLNLRGRNGIQLSEKWVNGPATYMGLAMSDFPNLFMVTGPGATFGNMPVGIEHHVEWITTCLQHMLEQGFSHMEVDPDSEEEWVRVVAENSERTVSALADSWYNGANVPGKVRAPYFYMGSFGQYRRKVEDIAETGYPGFVFSTADEAVAAVAG